MKMMWMIVRMKMGCCGICEDGWTEVRLLSVIDDGGELNGGRGSNLRQSGFIWNIHCTYYGMDNWELLACVFDLMESKGQD